MNIPKYWAKESQEVVDAKGRLFLAQCWRWSDVSYGDARSSAREAIKEIARKLRDNERVDRYAYGERPLREEIIATISKGSRDPLAIITRNGYGALVLNTARAMFVDIDFEPQGSFKRMMAALGRLLGPSSMSEEEQHIARLRQWIQGHPRWSMRVYRTKAGLRCLMTHDTFDPSLGSTTEVLKSLGADPLYVTLCKNQASFRARLTPKPWRCGVETPPNKYPWEDQTEQGRYRRWEDRYERVIANFTTCRLVAVIGRTRPHRDVATIQGLHDRYACVDDKFRLA